MKKTHVFLVLAVPLLLGGSLNYSGMCIPKFRWMEERELIAVAVLHVYEEYQKRPPQRFRIPGVYSKNIQNHVTYSSFDEFVQRNPDCCTLSDTGWKGLAVGFFSRVIGYSTGFVRVEFAADAAGFTLEDRAWIAAHATKYTGVHDKKIDDLNHKNLSFVPIDNCGQIWRGH